MCLFLVFLCCLCAPSIGHICVLSAFSLKLFFTELIHTYQYAQDFWNMRCKYWLTALELLVDKGCTNNCIFMSSLCVNNLHDHWFIIFPSILETWLRLLSLQVKIFIFTNWKIQYETSHNTTFLTSQFYIYTVSLTITLIITPTGTSWEWVHNSGKTRNKLKVLPDLPSKKTKLMLLLCFTFFHCARLPVYVFCRASRLFPWLPVLPSVSDIVCL